MNNITCNPNSEQTDGKLFVNVTPDTMDEYPDLFGGAASSSKLAVENKESTNTFQEQELMKSKPEMIITNAANSRKNSAGICYKFIGDISQRKMLLRYQDKLYMLDGCVYRPYIDERFMSNVFNYICSCNFELSYRDIVHIVNELKMRAENFRGEPNDERYTYCRNGFFNNQTGTLEVIAPNDYFPTIQLSGSYLGRFPQHHPLMDQFLSVLFDKNDILIRRAWEILG